MAYILLRSPACPPQLGDYYMVEKEAGERRGTTVTQVIERVKAHYEVQAVEMGTVCRWCPESVVVECNCGQQFSVEGANKAASCPSCGADHTGLVRELGDKKPLTKEEAYHPARREYEAWMKDEGNHRRHSEGLYGEGLFSGLAAKDARNRVLDVLDGS
jgi:hypothetical protein